MRIQDIMSNRVITISPEATAKDAQRQFELHEVNHLVVMDRKKVVGVVSASDVKPAPADQKVSNIMSRGIVTIEPDATLRRAAGVMEGRSIGCLPVLEEGQLRGIVTTADMLRALAKGVHAGPATERAILKKRGPRRKHIAI